MDLSHLEVDADTGIYKWPTPLQERFWSMWTSSPCAVLFGEVHTGGYSFEASKKIGEHLRSPHWPHLLLFQVGGGLVVIAPNYSPEQALLFCQWVNREISSLFPPRPSHYDSRELSITWGIAVAQEKGWDLPNLLYNAVSAAKRAVKEGRSGSINESPGAKVTDEHAGFWVCSFECRLTGLPVWRPTLALRSHYDHEPTALLMGDIDNFKRFNDMVGHGRGDVLLQHIAGVLNDFESAEITAFRLGGDEFVIWVRGRTLDEAAQLAEQINTQVRALEVQQDNVLPPLSNFSLTWGVVAAAPHKMDIEAMIRKAEELVQEGKSDSVAW